MISIVKQHDISTKDYTFRFVHLFHFKIGLEIKHILETQKTSALLVPNF